MKEFSLEDFLEDFLVEAHQHLQSINQSLLALEKTLAPITRPEETELSRVDLINTLFRSFHTLKGLAGMVGLRPVEELSHLMESILREIQKSRLQVNQDVIDRLFEGTEQLKASVSSLTENGAEAQDISGISSALSELLYRPIDSTQSLDQEVINQAAGINNQPVWDETGNVARIKALLHEYPGLQAALEEQDYLSIQAVFQAKHFCYLIIFTPSAYKSESGKNVSDIREKLSKAGKLIKSVPLIGQGVLRFAFIASTPKPLPLEIFQEADVFPVLEMEPVGDKEEETASLPKEEISRPHKTAPASATSSSTSIRVDLGKLDDLMRLVSEMVVVKSRLYDLLPKLQTVNKFGQEAVVLDLLEQSIDQLDRNLRDMRFGVMRARMVPLSEVFNHMPLAVRDLARVQGKEVRLVVEGEQTEIDKMLVEHLLDPLLHLIRNAITHGIELPSDRVSQGKPAFGSVVLRGRWEGDYIVIEVADDGCGIDTKKVVEIAQALRIITPGQVLDETNILDILSKPGFTTLEEAHLGAGRGIGMEVVVQSIRSVGGTIEMKSQPGQGTIFKMLLPLTLTIMDAIIVRLGSDRYAIPQHTIEEVFEINTADIVEVESGELISFRQNPVGLIRLSRLFQLPDNNKHSTRLYGLLCCLNEKRGALVVDQLIGLREVVVRGINDPLVTAPGIFGATDLGDGQVILILDTPALLEYNRSLHAVPEG
jgi:two-component system, chemotaxis family, sensor kinase CheA